MVHFVATHKSEKARDTARFFLSYVVHRHGLTHTVICDRGSKFLKLGYHPCLAPDTFWETWPTVGQSTKSKAWMKQMHEDWQRARSALVALKTNTTARANRHLQLSQFKVGDLVMVRMFPVN